MGASDVHVAVGSPIMFRKDRELVPASKGPVSSTVAQQIVKAVLGDAKYKEFQEEKEMDVSYSVSDELRLRVNCHFEKGSPSLVARIISNIIPTMEEAGLIGVADQFCKVREGLILFTGPTGAGKSTSMAAMIEEIRQLRSAHVLTLEDPVEFIFPQREGGIIRQRQAGEDFNGFGEALRRVLRQDPDIVMVGEMRDLETVAAALTLAETGHLVFGTLHTPNTMQTVDRIVDVFPPHQQSQVRSQLSMALKLVISQRLLPKVGGGLTPLREVLVNTPAVANIIRENRIPELISALQMGAEDGMITFEKDAKRLLKEGLIDDETFDNAMGVIDAADESKKKKKK